MIPTDKSAFYTFLFHCGRLKRHYADLLLHADEAKNQGEEFLFWYFFDLLNRIERDQEGCLAAAAAFRGLTLIQASDNSYYWLHSGILEGSYETAWEALTAVPLGGFPSSLAFTSIMWSA